jgi:hypothetical protein
MFGIGLPELIIIFFLLFFGLILTVLPFWKIYGKAGFNPGLGFLMIVPIVNVAMLFYLAFAEWPCLRDRKASDSSAE